MGVVSLGGENADRGGSEGLSDSLRLEGGADIEVGGAIEENARETVGGTDIIGVGGARERGGAVVVGSPSGGMISSIGPLGAVTGGW